MEREGDQVLPPQPDLSTVGQQINVEKAEGLADKVKLYQPGFSPAANGPISIQVRCQKRARTLGVRHLFIFMT